MVELQDIEKKWQHEWEKCEVFNARINKNKKKFFATFPYPYLNGPLHIGHAFTSTRVDVFSRYKRLKGFNVLFPFGFHATGEPIVGMAKRVKSHDPKQIHILKESGVSNEDIKKFEDPYHIVKFYKSLIKENAKSLGLSIDWTRSFTTIDPEYTKFISWQYTKLKDLGYIVKGTHPVIWCPKDQSPTGDHDRLEGEGVSPVEFTLLKFKLNDSFLVAATLRPETVFGVTNMWVKSDSDLVKAKVNNEKWIISKEAAVKLSEQLKDVKILEEFKGKELINKSCVNLVTNREIKILAADFVDPDNATGIVMSVPAHAPYDYIALRNLEEEGFLAANEIKPVSLIKVEGYGQFPAIEVCNKFKIENQKDSRLDEATKEVYKKEFHTGILNENCGKYNGLRVSECKEVIIKDLKEQGIADSMFETDDTVVCRCNTKCVVKILKDQWFLKYSDEKWKKLVRKCLSDISLYP
ncbi:leucine--tRNA ligase, partial [Candidatus Woesearchaeota archaeon]|nr:leucine--tRNA ligase [Candidatus Woesearchaeota archaeon]